MKSFWRNCSGATALEYALIISLIVIVTIIGMQMVTGATQNTYNKVTDSVGNTTLR